MVDGRNSDELRRLPSIRLIIGALVVAVLLPVLALMAAYGAWNIRLQQHTAELGLLNTARALSLAVDRELEGIKTVLVAFATSDAVRAGDLTAIHERASDLARAHGGWIVLSDPKGQQQVNTLMAPGKPLPSNASPEMLEQVHLTGEPVLSDLVFGRAAGRWIVAVLVPIVRDGEIVSTLHMALLPERLNRLLSSNEMPPGWTAAIVDRNGIIIAGSDEGEKHVGQPAPPWLAQYRARAPKEVGGGRTRDGTMVEAAFAGSNLSGWTTVVMQPVESYEAPVRRAGKVMAAGGVASLVLALAAAWYIGQRITVPLQRLARNAESIINGEPVDVSRTSVAEIAGVHGALLKAAARHREEAEARIELAWERKARQAAEAAHQEILRRELRFRRLIEANLIGILVASESGFVEANDAFLKIIGYRREETDLVRATWPSMTPAEYANRDRKALQEILERGECIPYEKAYVRKDGSLVHVLIGCAKVEAADLTWICYVVDLTPQKEAEAGLRVSEERYRALTEATATVVWTTAADGSVADMPQWREMTGQTVEQCRGWGWLDALHPDDRLATKQAWSAAVGRRASYDIEYRIRHADGRYQWYNARGVPVLNGDGSVREWVGVCINVEGRKAAEERQLLLMAELDHRVRNILASIQAMITLTAQGAPTKEEYSRRLYGRIGAMARTHGLLTRQHWKGASLQRLVEDELAAYGQSADAVVIEGEPADLILKPRTALTLSLILHELATNAAKYGALSAPAGRVTVTWQLSREAKGSRLLLCWRESNGPEVMPPSRSGFGSTLIRSALAGEADSNVTLEFASAGVECQISLLLRQSSPERETSRPSVLAEAPKRADREPLQLRRGRVLVAEDEPLVGMELVSILTAVGIEVIGPVATLDEALAQLEEGRIDAAALDVNLRGRMSYPLADKLVERGVPIVFVTGYEGRPLLPERYKDVAVLQKPVEAAALVREIVALLPPSLEEDATATTRLDGT